MHKKELSEEEKSRYKDLFLYIAFVFGGIGRTQLAKLFFHADCEFFVKQQKTLSGDDYIKHRYGPVPCNFKAILREMEAEGKIEFILTPNFDYPTRELHIKERFKMTSFQEITSAVKRFTSEETVVVNQNAFKIVRENARKLSAETHQSIYHALKIGEHIPNFMLPYYFDDPITENDIMWAKEKTKEPSV